MMLESVIALKAIFAEKLIGKEVAVGAAIIFLLNGTIGGGLFHDTFFHDDENLNERGLRAHSAGRINSSVAASLGAHIVIT